MTVGMCVVGGAFAFLLALHIFLAIIGNEMRRADESEER